MLWRSIYTSAFGHVRVGEALGLFNGNHLGAHEPEFSSWMAAGRAHSWVAVAEEAFGDLGILRSDLMLSRWIGEANVDRTLGLWSELDALKTALIDP